MRRAIGFSPSRSNNSQPSTRCTGSKPWIVGTSPRPTRDGTPGVGAGLYGSRGCFFVSVATGPPYGSTGALSFFAGGGAGCFGGSGFAPPGGGCGPIGGSP